MKHRRILEYALITLVVAAGPAGYADAGAGTPIPANTWVMMKTKGVPAQVMGFGRLVYASGFKRTVMLENYHQLGSEPDEALLAYDFTGNRWDVLNLGGNFHTEDMSDGGHSVGAITYNPNQNTFLYYGMFSGSQALEMPLHTWWYDPFGQVGRDKHTSPKPGQTLFAGAAFDVAHNTYVLFGGDTVTYDPTTNQWSKKTPAGTPPTSAGGYPSMDYNSANQKVYMFGGQGTYWNDVYSYDVPTNTWIHHAPSGTPPPPRREAAFASNYKARGSWEGNFDLPNGTWTHLPVNPEFDPNGNLNYSTYLAPVTGTYLIYGCIRGNPPPGCWTCIAIEGSVFQWAEPGKTHDTLCVASMVSLQQVNAGGTIRLLGYAYGVPNYVLRVYFDVCLVSI